MTQYGLLDPKTDFIFKLIFGNEKHPNILISFLNAVIKPIDQIVSVQIKNVELEKKHIEDKFSRLDVLAKTSNNEIVNIEIQLKDEKNMIKRSLYYLSRMYESQLGSGENYRKLPRTVAINILRFNYLKEEYFHNAYRFKNNNELTDVMEIHFIELPKFDEKKEGKELIENLKSLDMLKAWTLFLKEPSSQSIRTLENSIEEIKHAKDELTLISADEKNRYFYEMREASLHDRVSALEGAEEKGYNKAKEEYEEKLLNEKRDMVLNLLQMGLSKEQISKATKLSLLEIEHIQKF